MITPSPLPKLLDFTWVDEFEQNLPYLEEKKI